MVTIKIFSLLSDPKSLGHECHVNFAQTKNDEHFYSHWHHFQKEFYPVNKKLMRKYE